MKKISINIFIILFSIFILFIENANAIRTPRDKTIDKRLKTFYYHPEEVYKFTGVFNYQTILEFEPGEKINTISIGEPEKWQVISNGHKIFIKPIGLIAEEHETNMTVISDKRRYFFELYAHEAESLRDNNIPFLVTFIYPENSNAGIVEGIGESYFIDTSDMSKFNTNYKVSGSRYIEPIETFDDGKFTYIRFQKGKPIPAIMEVNHKGYEGILNFRVEGKYIAIEGTYSQFTLRHGDEVTCLYNEAMPFPKKTKKK